MIPKIICLENYFLNLHFVFYNSISVISGFKILKFLVYIGQNQFFVKTHKKVLRDRKTGQIYVHIKRI